MRARARLSVWRLASDEDEHATYLQIRHHFRVRSCYPQQAGHASVVKPEVFLDPYEYSVRIYRARRATDTFIRKCSLPLTYITSLFQSMYQLCSIHVMALDQRLELFL